MVDIIVADHRRHVMFDVDNCLLRTDDAFYAHMKRCIAQDLPVPTAFFCPDFLGIVADRLRGTSSKYDAVLDDAAKLEEMILGDFIATDEYRNNLPPLDPHQAEFVREMTKRYNVHLISARFEADREFTIPNLIRVGIEKELVENRLHLVGDYPKVDVMREIADLSKWLFAFEDAPINIRELLLALPEEGRVYVPISPRARNDLKSLGNIERRFRKKMIVFDSYQRLQHLVD